MKTSTKGAVGAVAVAAAIATLVTVTVTRDAPAPQPEQTVATAAQTTTIATTTEARTAPTAPLDPVVIDPSTTRPSITEAATVAPTDTDAQPTPAPARRFSARAVSQGSAASLAVTPVRLRARFSVDPDMGIWIPKLDANGNRVRDASGKKLWEQVKPNAIRIDETVTFVCEGAGRWATREHRLRNVALSNVSITCVTAPTAMTARMFLANDRKVYQIQRVTPLEWTIDPESVAVP